MQGCAAAASHLRRYVPAAAAAWRCRTARLSTSRPPLQGIVRPVTWATFVTAALSPLYNWYFIVRLGLGLEGAALAVVALQATSLALLGGYIVLRNLRRVPLFSIPSLPAFACMPSWRVAAPDRTARLLSPPCSRQGHPESTWGGWSRKALQGWGRYLSLALPSVVLVCCKWCGDQGSRSFAAQGSCIAGMARTHWAARHAPRMPMAGLAQVELRGAPALCRLDEGRANFGGSNGDFVCV